MRVLEFLILRRLASFAGALFCICFGVSCSTSEAPPAQSADPPQVDALKTETFRNNEVSANEIVFKVADCETDDRTAFLARVTNTARELAGEEDIEVSQVGNGCWFLARSSKKSASELLNPFLLQIEINRAAEPEFKQVPEIVDAEPNFIIRLKPHHDDRPVQGSPDDDYFQRGELWGFVNQQYPDVHIDALRAWQVSKGSQQIVVGVIDTGIYYLHPDLHANVWCAPRDFTVTLGTDKINCPSGSHGFNVVGRTDAERCDPLDGIRNPGHGTHVSGTIGAIGDNQRGVVGVNWTTRLLGLKFMKYGDGTAANAKRAIDFAVELKKELKLDADIRVLNVSWGYRSDVTTRSDSDMLREAIEDAGKKGILVVASAGEDGGSNNDEIEHYPSGFNLENVVSVTAIDRKGLLADRANYGMTSVHLSAPGSEIYSTYSMNLGYDYYVSGGTSMAAAFVSGAAALILSVPECSKLSPADLKQMILRGVSSPPTPSSRPIPTSSGGMLDVYKSIEQCSTEAVLKPFSRNH